MKKIGIITFHRAINYGGVLQNYSLQKKLINLGFEAETVDFYSNPVYNIYDAFYLGKLNLIKTPLRIAINIFNYKNNKKLKNKFYEFINENICLSNKYNRTNIKNITKKYDYIISGSDQVWNKDITQEDYDIYDLSIFEYENKIAYAASMGKDNISLKEVEYYRDLINAYKNASVREKSIASKLGGSVDIVLDPVFFHNKEEWIKNLSLKNAIKNEYVFVFSLERTRDISNIIKELSKKYKIIYYSKVPTFNKNVVCKFDMSPKEFLETILNAKFIITNSFHCLAFSIIFNKNFSAILHTNKGSRQKDLLNLLGLENRIFNNNLKELMKEDIDFNNINIKIKKLKEKSEKFLIRNLK